MRILVACNTLTQISQEAYTDHMMFYYRLGKNYPKYTFLQFNARRLSIDRFRNTAFSYAVNLGCSYILFIDDDMKFSEPAKVFGPLYEACQKGGYDIVAALNYIRGYPYDPMAFEFEDIVGKKNLVHLSEEVIDAGVAENKVVECSAIGTAVCLIKMKRLKKLPAPWFITGPHNTEDIYFCIKAKEYNKKVKIGVHCGVITGHLLDQEVISYHTRKHLRTYCEAYMTPNAIESANNQDRGLAYINENIADMLKGNETSS